VRRTVTVLIATVGALGLLASFHTTSTAAKKGAVGVVPLTQPPASGGPPTTGATVPTTTTLRPTAPLGGTTPPTSAAPTTAAPAARTIDGPVESNQFGDVQVQITVSGGRLVDVEALELPSDRRHSQELSDFAGPQLRQEALQAQSANIDTVAGATYTSDGYIQSLQAALNQAGL
jgi:uncharacterized protein with FMN-binding domain